MIHTFWKTFQNHQFRIFSYLTKMEHLLEEHVSTEDLKKFETRYQTELNGGQVSTSAQFDYAWCLVRSRYPSDIRKGLLLLEDLYRVSFGLTHQFFKSVFSINIFFFSKIRIEMKVANGTTFSTLLSGMLELKNTRLLWNLFEVFYKLNPETDKPKN